MAHTEKYLKAREEMAMALDKRQRVKASYRVPSVGAQPRVKAADKEPEKPGESAPSVSRPTKSEGKGAWVKYAVSQGMDRDEAEAHTKADLIEATAK